MSEGNVVALPNSTAARIAQTGVLLEAPKYVGGPGRHDVVYALSGGRVGTCPLARYRLPEGVRGGVLVGPGSADEDGLAMLPLMAEIADRIAPWFAVHVVPKVLRRQRDDDDFGRASGSYEVDGTHYSSAGGIAHRRTDLVLVKFGSPIWMLHALCHELLHAVWRNLSDDARAVLERAASSGPAWPGNYFSNAEERVARLFEAWAWNRIEGMPLLVDDHETDMTTSWIFEEIWSGRLADGQIRRDLVPGAAALAARRGLEMLPPPAPELPPAPPPRAWDDRLVDGILGAGGRFQAILDFLGHVAGRTAA